MKKIEIIKGKEKFLIIAILVFIANFILLSFSYSQTNINLRAYVPETEANKNFSSAQIKQNKPTTKENKYLYFFEKFWLSQADKESGIGLQKEAQTIHDKIMSYFLMGALLVIIAIIIFIFLRAIDLYIISHFRS